MHKCRKFYNLLLNVVPFETLAAVTMMSVLFWDVTPSSPVEIYWHFEEEICLHPLLSTFCALVAFLAHISTLKMGGNTSETSVNYRTIRHYIKEVRSRYVHYSLFSRSGSPAEDVAAKAPDLKELRAPEPPADALAPPRWVDDASESEVNLRYSLVEGPVVGARGWRLCASSAVVMASFFVYDAHQLHPGVVLRVAPHATRLPHGARNVDTSASRNEPSTPLPGVEGTVTGRSFRFF
jgi:hypothetical protein